MEGNIEYAYLNLLRDVIVNGVVKRDRTGTGTISVFGRQIRHKMSLGFPLFTTKKMYFKGIVTELLWFLRGDTNIKYLLDNDCHIWDGDAYKKFFTEATKVKSDYLEGSLLGYQDHIDDFFDDLFDLNILTKKDFIEKIKTDELFCKKWGELGPIYGRQWKKWPICVSSQTDLKDERGKPIKVMGIKYIDQIKNLINDLKTNPDSRRLIVNAWNPGDIHKMTLPPCHYSFQCYTRELSHQERVNLTMFEEASEEQLNEMQVPLRAISLMFNMRSNDMPLGSPFNIASYALLLEILAKTVNMVSDELICNIGDSHIYIDQLDGINEQLTREPYQLPSLEINASFLNSDIDKLDGDMFELVNYKSHPTIKMPLSN